MKDRYELRYCAFIDILGFANLVLNRRSDPQDSDFIRRLLLSFRAGQLTSMRGRLGSGFEVQIMSDAIVVSAPTTAIALDKLFKQLTHSAIELLAAGYFVRGAIVKDLLCHEEELVFGPGLVRAYHFEQNTARYPRIMIAREVVEDVAAYGASSQLFENRTMQAADGPHYLHILRRLEHIASTRSSAEDAFGSLSVWTRCRANIQSRLEEAADNPQHFEKVHWFAQYWNKTVEPDFRLGRIQGPGL